MLIAREDAIELTDADDGALFVVRVVRTGEERVARYHVRELVGLPLRVPRFADPDRPHDYLLWLTADLTADAVRRL